jgi:Tol biopolymer transport system component
MGGAPGQWQSLDLTQDPADSSLWTGVLSGVSPGQVQFMVQAVNGVGLVSLDDNLGGYYRPGQIPAALHSSPVPLTTTSLALNAPASGSYGGETAVTATLTAGASPLDGETVRFSLGGSQATAVTDSNGVATVDLPVLGTPGSSTLSAAYDGTTTNAASAASQPFEVTKLSTSLAVTAEVSAPTVGGDTGVVATVTTAAGVPVTDHTVLFRITPATGPVVTVARVTGLSGQARLGPVTLPDGKPLGPGSYAVAAYFGPNPALGFAVPADPIYGPSSGALGAPLTLTRRIVFASSRTGNGDIYAIDPAGGSAVQLTSGPAIDTEPEWSPSGDKIVFSSTRDGNVEIFTMDHDGTDVVRVTTNSAIDTSPAWSPNGERIAFASNRGSGNNWDIYTMNVNGSGLQRLTTHSKEDLLPTWSPSGTQIAFMSRRSGNGDIYTMNANGSSQTKRTTSNGIDAEPAWSGSTIAFSTDRHGSSNFEIYTMTQTGGSQTRITNQAGHDVTPAWSSDGTQLAFASNRPPGGGLNFNIFTMKPNGSLQTPVVTHAAADVFPDW